MRKAAKQIILCAFGLLIFCVVCRMTVYRSYTAHVLMRPQTASVLRSSTVLPWAEVENPDIAHIGEMSVHDQSLSFPIHPGRRGQVDIQIHNPDGEIIASQFYKVGPGGTVYDYQTGGFTGDTAVLIAVTLFWFAVSLIMFWHYRRARGADFYSYYTIYYVGFSLFSFVTGLQLLRVTVEHMVHPAEFSMYSAYGFINGASRQFMMLTLPAVLLFALAMGVSNVELLRHEGVHMRNTLGLIVSILLIAGEAIGVYLFTRDFSGSEWEGRIRNTLENVYATIFVYFECMLIGSVVCGVQAARHVPAPDKDCIVILGCWFRRDGTLPPLLRGRVDKALSFWRQQKEQTGKEAILIPSGGQGRNETMPEAEAMRNYLLAQGIPENCIHPETESKNTYQNMAYSKAIVDEIRPGGKTVFATTNYHVFRSGIWAVQAGLKAEGIGGKTKWWFWPNAFMRECAGLLQKRWKQEILFLLLLLAFFSILSVVLA